ncbi:hypothetical protein SVIOM74S_03808 [Streptomyces violarus]
MASLDRELVFRDPHTMEIKKTVPVSCYGVNHADFSLDGRYFDAPASSAANCSRSTPRR